MGQGLNGFRGQAMSGQRVTSAGVIIASSYLTGASLAATGSVIAPATGTAYIYVIGAGGHAGNAGISPGGGGGGGAAFRTITVRRGDTFTVSAAAIPTSDGADGADSTVTCPDGSVVRGGGGKGGVSPNSGLGGTGTGGDINRSGGAGGDPGSAGEGTGAGAGGLGPGSGIGGGGAAGFGDHGDMYAGGNGGEGSTGSQGATPGGGSGTGGAGNHSGAGRAIVIILSNPSQ